MPESACPSCGEQLPPAASFCPTCGSPANAVLPGETVPGPAVRDRVEPRWFGVPASFLLLCLGFAAFGAAIGLFATGSWPWGILALVVALVLLAAVAEAARRGEAGEWTARSSRFAADGRSQAATAAEVWRTRLDASLARWRTRSRLDEIELQRGPALQALGEAVWQNDKTGQREARKRLAEIDAERLRVETELSERLVGAEERILRARLPVQETLMVTPNQPSQPYPPPDEGDPPEPAIVPEPYPPPDEGAPPTPAPDE